MSDISFSLDGELIEATHLTEPIELKVTFIDNTLVDLIKRHYGYITTLDPFEEKMKMKIKVGDIVFVSGGRLGRVLAIEHEETDPRGAFVEKFLLACIGEPEQFTVGRGAIQFTVGRGAIEDVYRRVSPERPAQEPPRFSEPSAWDFNMFYLAASRGHVRAGYRLTGTAYLGAGDVTVAVVRMANRNGETRVAVGTARRRAGDKPSGDVGRAVAMTAALKAYREGLRRGALTPLFLRGKRRRS